MHPGLAQQPGCALTPQSITATSRLPQGHFRCLRKTWTLVRPHLHHWLKAVPRLNKSWGHFPYRDVTPVWPGFNSWCDRNKMKTPKMLSLGETEQRAHGTSLH